MSSVFKTIDFETPSGQQVKAFLLERLEELRNQVESPTLGMPETQAVRGALQEIRRLLNAAPPVVSGPRYSGMSFTKGGK
jgi:hypothetical protein